MEPQFGNRLLQNTETSVSYKEHRGSLTSKLPKRIEPSLSKLLACLMVGVPPTGIVIAEKVQLYKRKHCTERNAYECDLSVPVTDWPHPAGEYL